MQLWSFIIVLTLATVIGVLISQDPGYALFSYGDWAIEMPLWITVILLLFLVIASLFIIWTLNTVFSGGDKVKNWWSKHQERTAKQQTFKGLLELAAGRWKNAERYLIQSASHNESPLINYLSAAKAAEASGSPERRDQYLQLAFNVSGNSDFAVRLTQAQLQADHGELKASIRNLERLLQESPKHPGILKLLASLYEANQDWQSLYDLLPILRKTHIFTLESLGNIENKVYPALLPVYAEKDLKNLIRFWQDSPKTVQANHTQITTYAKFLVKLGASDEAEALLRSALKKQWDNHLVHLYGLINSQIKKQLTFIESFLTEYAEEPILLLSAGRLCMRNQLWGKARDYLEKSLSLAPLPETYAELGQLMENLGLTSARDEYFKKGLLSATQMVATNLTDQTLYLT